MVKLIVEPPEYYPVVEKFFADGLVEALEALGVDIVSMKAGVNEVKDRIVVGFIIELTKPEAFPTLELETIISAVLEKLAGDATKRLGKLYNATFEVAGFKLVESHRVQKNRETKLIVNAPDDMRRNLERLGKGLAIYLKDRNVDFSALTINVPKDGRPKAIVALLLQNPTHPLEKERISRSITPKVRSYLGTLNMEYLRVEVKVLDPDDKKDSLVFGDWKNTREVAEGDKKDETVKEVLGAFGEKFPEL
ncbi:MAG: hypothetical protein J7L37_03360 [Thermococcus sp.]|nr:hypothetical protein [Thermococcus sp.]